MQILFQALQNGVTAINNLSELFRQGLNSVAAYPNVATPLTASSGNVANASAVATLAGASGVTTYLQGFIVTSSGATAASVVSITVTGPTGGTMTFAYTCVAGATTQNPVFEFRFPVAIPASTTNTSIVVTLPALGAGNTNAAVVAYGYRL